MMRLATLLITLPLLVSMAAASFAQTAPVVSPEPTAERPPGMTVRVRPTPARPPIRQVVAENELRDEPSSSVAARRGAVAAVPSGSAGAKDPARPAKASRNEDAAPAAAQVPARPQSSADLPRSADSGRSAAAPSTRVARIWPCQVSLIHEVDIPAPETGLIVSMEVTSEQAVEQGQLLATIDSRQQELQRDASELERNAARTKAADDVEVRYAEASYEKASVELEDALAINKRNEGSVTQTRIRELRLEKERARLQIERSKLDLKVAGMTASVHDARLRLAEENVERRKIVAPFDGEVISVNAQPDEWVSAGDTVYRIIRLDRVRVEGLVSVKDFDPSEIHGRDVTVEVELARGKLAQFIGRVTHVNPIVKSNLYRVRAEVENRQQDGFWLLQSGRDATMLIHLE